MRAFAVLVCCLACTEPPGPEPSPVVPVAPREEAPPPTSPRPTVLYVGGDVLDGEALRDYARTFDDPADGLAAVLSPLASRWSEPDAFVLVNLEVPIADARRFALDATEAAPGRVRRVHLQGAPWICEGLARAGVDAVGLANNHALDQAREGLAETVRCARRAGLAVTGVGPHPNVHWPLVLGDEGRTLAVHSLYTGLDRGSVDPGEHARAFLDDDALAQVRQSATDHDTVVAVVHVVAELEEEVDDAWRGWATRLVDAGADAIVVHGTHLPMRVERFGARRVPVAWGLGNLISDMGRLSGPRRQAEQKEENAATREGLVARLRRVEAHALSLEVLPVFVLDDRFLRWHGALPPMHGADGAHADEIHFWLHPLGGCDEPAALPSDWREPWRSELVRWMRARRDDAVGRTGLSPTRCEDEGWLSLL
ncbi:MAG: CapA family protein [Sandaracinus sp.]|nr:CapA family protein [Sandaracinus sp.]